MKKVFFVFTLVLGFMFTKSQEVNISYNDQEEGSILLANTVKVDAFKMITGTALDIGYERYVSKYVSVGGNITLGLGEYSENGAFSYTTDFSVDPYFRGYFSEAKEYGSRGFFAEVGVSLGSETVEFKNYIDHHYNNMPSKSTGFQAIFGAGTGWKWANKGGFVFEVNLGIGRRLLSNEPDQGSNTYSNAIKVIPKGGLFFGYSF